MVSKTSRIIIFGLFLFFAAFGQTTITDDNWISMPGVNNRVSALVVDKAGNLIAGGDFDSAGGVSANYVALWDGSAWSALGSGTNRDFSWGGIFSLAVDSSGNLYAGGAFDTAGGIKANHIARWDGKSWSALGSGTNGHVTALALGDSGFLYAAGRFDTAGGVRVNHIARWDGKSWSGFDNGNYHDVVSLTVDDSGKLYASYGYLIVKWDGGKWDTLGIVGMSSSIHTFAVDKSNKLYIGASGWDGTTSIGNAGGSVTFACVASLNGAVWSGVGSGAWLSWDMGSSGPMGLAFDTTGNLFAAGYFKTAGGVSASNIARWDGNSWGPLGSGLSSSMDNGLGLIPQVNSLVIDKENNLYVGGLLPRAGGKPVSNIARCALNAVPVRSFLRSPNKPVFYPKIIRDKLLFSLAKPSSSQFKVFDCAGRLIWQSSQKVLGAGNHVMNISPLSPGVYLLDFHAGDQSFKGKFSITK